jgi:phospholipid-translocating ATPase
MHSKSVMALVSLVLSIGGWFLWNLILSTTYNPTSKVYYVRDTFLLSFGRSLTWWCALLLILTATFTFETGVAALRAAFFTTDEDVFQQLEKDPGVKRRFEEASANELQQGWDRESNKERDKEERVRAVVEGLRRKEQERREREVREMLRRRGDGDVEEGKRQSLVEQEVEREDLERMFSRGFGQVREE